MSEICNVFIAGSKKLKKEKDQILLALKDINDESDGIGTVTFRTKTFENFPNELTSSGHQSLYNEFIQKEADYVIVILDRKIGGYTLQEFETAVSAFQQKGIPKIFVYCKESLVDQQITKIRSAFSKDSDSPELATSKDVDSEENRINEKKPKNRIGKLLRQAVPGIEKLNEKSIIKNPLPAVKVGSKLLSKAKDLSGLQSSAIEAILERIEDLKQYYESYRSLEDLRTIVYKDFNRVRLRLLAGEEI